MTTRELYLILFFITLLLFFFYFDWRMLVVGNQKERYATTTTTTTTTATKMPTATTTTTAITPKKRLAILLFGRVGSFGHVPHFKMEADDAAVIRLTAPTLQQQVVAANERRGWRVDVFTQSWALNIKEEIIDIYNPVAHDIMQYPGHGTCFLAIERAVRLRQQWAAEQGIVHDIVLVLRYDIYFFNHTEWLADSVNGSLFYLNNWCRAAWSPRSWPDAAHHFPNRTCYSMQPIFTEAKTLSVPDHMFASSPSIIEHVFNDFAADVGGGRVQRSAANANHGIFSGRFRQKQVLYGRYYYMQMDFSLVRHLHLIPAYKVCGDLNLAWVGREQSLYDTLAQHQTSQCNNLQHPLNLCACTDKEKQEHAIFFPV